MTTYSMTPMSNGTRLRDNHSTFASMITSFNADEVLTGTELWEAPADGSEVKKGDKWLKVTHKNGVALSVSGWTAYIHKGVPICDNFRTVAESPDPEVPPVPAFPDWYILEHPDGTRAKFLFVGIVG